MPQTNSVVLAVRKYFADQAYFNKLQLRWYFGLIGLVGLYFCSTNLIIVLSVAVHFPPAFWFNLFSVLWGLLVSAGFLYFASTLPAYLRSDKVRFLKVSINGLFGTGFVWGAADYISGVRSLGLFGLLVFLPLELILWGYLHENIIRLSEVKRRISSKP